MKTVVLSLIMAVVLQNAKAPYVEFYAAQQKIDISKPIRSWNLKASFFSASGNEIKGQIQLAELTAVHRSTTLGTVVIKTTNEISFNKFKAQLWAGDRIILKIKEAKDTERNQPIYLSKSDFVFTVE